MAIYESEMERSPFAICGFGEMKVLQYDKYLYWCDVARTAIEAMRAVPRLCYDDYLCDEQWRSLNSEKVFNLWIDAALKEKS